MANNINQYSFLNVLDVPIVDKTDVTKVIVIDRDNTVKTMESNQIGFTDYNDLENKPFINNIELKGNISLDELDIPSKSIIDGEINDLKESDKLINSNILDLQNNKVDKEQGKSLIADSEIERLKTLKNYDDTQIKNEVSNNTKAIENEVQRATKAEKDNADAIKLKLDKTEASSIYATKTELNTKVDKVEGSRLITNAEAAQINTNKTDINNLKNNKLDKTEASQNYATKIDLNNKVDKVEGKSLLADSEIERLKTLTNYNDSAIKGDITKLQDEVNKNKTNIDLKLSKTEAESLYQPKGEYATKAELNNKVDKVTGKSLLEDTEIARLKTLVNYDDTQVKSDITQLKTDVEDNMLNISTNSTAISNINTKLKNTENLFVLDVPDSMQLDAETLEKLIAFLGSDEEMSKKIVFLQYDPMFIGYAWSYTTDRNEVASFAYSYNAETLVMFTTEVYIDVNTGKMTNLKEANRYEINNQFILDRVSKSNGIAPLNNNKKVPIENLPDSVKNTENLFIFDIPANKQLDTDTLNRLKTFIGENEEGHPAVVSYTKDNIKRIYYGLISQLLDTNEVYFEGVFCSSGDYDSEVIGYYAVVLYIEIQTGAVREDSYSENRFVNFSKVGKPYGIATLDKSGKVPINQIPTPEGGYLRPLFEKMPNVKYNPSTKLYDVWKDQGGISVTEEEMTKIYNNALPAYTNNIYCIAPGSRKQLYEPKALIPIAYQDGDSTEIVIGYIRTVQYIGLPSTQSNVLNRIYNADVLTRIDGILRVTGNVPTINLYNNPKLTWIQLRIEKTKPVTINMKNSPSIDYDSFRYIPNNVQGTTYSNITTISVDTLPYSLLTGTATEEQYTATGHTKEEWMKIVTDGTAKGITFAKSI